MKKIEFKSDTTLVNTAYAIGYKGKYETKTYEFIEIYYISNKIKTLLVQVPKKQEWLVAEIVNMHNQLEIEKEQLKISEWIG